MSARGEGPRVYDFAVVGGGIVGLATAMTLLAERPGASVIVLEKENDVARHQTGHNSGVIHAGIYYAPGSLKATLCRAGAQWTRDFCDEHGIGYRNTGKLIVATNEAELGRMHALYERALLNELDVELIDAAELRRREPNITGRRRDLPDQHRDRGLHGRLPKDGRGDRRSGVAGSACRPGWWTSTSRCPRCRSTSGRRTWSRPATGSGSTPSS